MRYSSKYKRTLIFMLFLLFHLPKLQAQINTRNSNFLIFGIGVNALNDSGGDAEDDLFNVTNYAFSRPLKLSVEKKINFNNGFELKFLLNKFVTTKKFNSGFPAKDIDFYAIDAAYKYYISSRKISFDRSYLGYVSVGAGRSFYDNTGGFTVNLGGGINYRIYENIMLNFQMTGKFSIDKSTSNNHYIQFEFGVLIPVFFNK